MILKYATLLSRDTEFFANASKEELENHKDFCVSVAIEKAQEVLNSKKESYLKLVTLQRLMTKYDIEIQHTMDILNAKE